MATVSNEKEFFNEVFTNDVVWKKLESYLNLDDLKDCRLTCQLFNTKIIALKNFRDRTVISIPLSKFLDFAKTRVQWMHLAINFDLDLDNESPENRSDFPQDSHQSGLSQLLSSIISLKLYPMDFKYFGISPEIPETFSKILVMVPNIQKMSIDVQVFEIMDLSWFTHASVALMSKVKEFHLECNPPTFVPGEIMRGSISLSLACMNLQVLRIDLFVGGWPYRRARGSVFDRLDLVLPILRKNQNDLKVVQVADPLLWTSVSTERFGTLPKFPQLKVLKLRIDTDERSQLFFSQAPLIQFLNDQPDSLEEIDLDFIGPIPSAVFQIVKDRAMNLKLKVLRIVTMDSTPSCMKKWNFLKETNLVEFSIQLEKGFVRLSKKQLQDFFGALPKTAKRLSFMGVQVPIAGGQAASNLEVSKCFDPEVLTHLNLRGWVGLLKDSVLQDFWKTLKNLRLLDLSYCASDCSDWGFTGVPLGAAPQGMSISSLKGLKALSLQSCVGLTDRTLLDGIQFPELQFLDLQYNFEFTKIGFLAVMHQNPSLQTFVSEHDHETYGNLLTHLDEIRQMRSAKINSRLTREFRVNNDCDRCFSDGDDESCQEIALGKESTCQMLMIA